MLPIPLSLIPKTRLALGIAVALLIVGLLCALLWLRGNLAEAREALTAEGAAHNATRHELAQARTANNMLQADQRNSNATISALTRQIRAAQVQYRSWQKEEAARRAMLAHAEARPRPPEEAAKVVDNATRHAAADMLNAW